MENTERGGREETKKKQKKKGKGGEEGKGRNGEEETGKGRRKKRKRGGKEGRKRTQEGEQISWGQQTGFYVMFEILQVTQVLNKTQHSSQTDRWIS